MYYDRLGGLRREYHHIKSNRDDGQEGYEPAMVILHHGKIGRSFIIPLSAIWKYVEPKDNNDAYPSDLREFNKIVSRSIRDQRIGQYVTGVAGDKIRRQASEDLQACVFATALWNTNKILTCVGWNLFKAISMFDLEVSPQTAAQLLLFIQDGLDQLKNMPEAPAEKQLPAGEITLYEDGKKIVSKDIGVEESELVIEEEGSA